MMYSDIINKVISLQEKSFKKVSFIILNCVRFDKSFQTKWVQARTSRARLALIFYTTIKQGKYSAKHTSKLITQSFPHLMWISCLSDSVQLKKPSRATLYRIVRSLKLGAPTRFLAFYIRIINNKFSYTETYVDKLCNWARRVSNRRSIIKYLRILKYSNSRSCGKKGFYKPYHRGFSWALHKDCYGQTGLCHSRAPSLCAYAP